jgi:hypothetical protein
MPFCKSYSRAASSKLERNSCHILLTFFIKECGMSLISQLAIKQMRLRWRISKGACLLQPDGTANQVYLSHHPPRSSQHIGINVIICSALGSKKGLTLVIRVDGALLKPSVVPAHPKVVIAAKFHCLITKPSK